MKQIRNFVLVGVLFAGGAFANNLLTNGSFELGTFVNDGNGEQLLNAGSTTMTGWTVNGGTGATLSWLNNTNTYGGVATPYGSYFLDLTGYYDTNPFAGVQQIVSLAAGNYSLTFYLGSYQSSTAPKAGGPVSLTATAGTTSNTFTTPSSGSGNVWGLQTLNFSVATAGNVTISLVGVYAANHSYLGLDNVDLELVTSGVPEPAMSIPLALAGVLFVLGRRKRARP